MRSLSPKLIFTAALAVLIAASSQAAASGGVSVGESVGGYETLGGTDQNGLSIITQPSGATMGLLLPGDPVTAIDSMAIFADEYWELTVVELGQWDEMGYMRMGTFSDDDWFYSLEDGEPPYNGYPLTNRFVVNDEDLSEGSGSAVVASGSSSEENQQVQIAYSQQVTAEDAVGLYRIDLKYTLSPAES